MILLPEGDYIGTGIDSVSCSCIEYGTTFKLGLRRQWQTMYQIMHNVLLVSLEHQYAHLVSFRHRVRYQSKIANFFMSILMPLSNRNFATVFNARKIITTEL